MAYSGQFLRFSWLYTVAGTDEIADTSLNFSSGSGWTGAVAALAELEVGTLADVRDEIIETHDYAGRATYSQLVALKVAAIGVDGAYLASPQLIETDVPTSGSTQGVPAQCSVVLSWRSGFTLGSGNYGRMFLPHTRPAFTDGTPYIAPTVQDGISTRAAAFVTAITALINDDTTATMIPSIMSQVGGGGIKEIVSVGVGRVVDTQRRRRNALTENYDFTAI